MQSFSYSWKALGTDCFIEYISKTPPEEVFLTSIAKEVEEYESMFSRFRSSSELSSLNTHQKNNKEMPVSDLFFDVFQKAKLLVEQTNGTFNPLLSPVFLGYNADFVEHNTSFAQDFFPPAYNHNFTDIFFDKNKKLIQLAPGQKIDFGGFLKGYLAQYIAEKYQKNNQGIIVNIGGDIAVRGKDTDSDVFSMAIENPVIHTDITLSLQNTSLSTSGVYKRKWHDSHHIVDLHSHQSAQSDLISASIIHPDGAFCDALSTCAIVWGKEKAQRFCDTLSISYVFITHDGEVHSFV